MDGQLALLQRENSMVVPGRLPECSERYRMLTLYRGISRTSFTNMGQKVRGEQSSSRFHRLEHHSMTDNLTAVSADDLGGCDFPCFFAEIKIRTAHIQRPFG